MQPMSGASLGMHLLEVEITTRCNFDCKHCYNRNRNITDMPVDRVLALLTFAQEKGVSSFVFSGGEASLHPQFDLLAETLLKIKPSLRLVLQTNGAASKKPIDLLRAFKVVHLSYEPDGSEVRKVASRQIVEFALQLKRQGIYAYLFATVHKGNIDKIDDIVRVANEAELDIGLNLCVPTHESPELALSPEQALQVSRKLYGLFREGKILRFTSPLVAMFCGKKSAEYIGNRGGCTAGIAACSVTIDGDVIPCPFFRTVTAGNVFQQGLERIWLGSEVLAELRDRSKFDQPCGSCEFLSYCAGCRKRAFDSSGKLTGPDPGCFLKLIS
jgi:radical SAM protein with 4Fe4S-binding SPASM domain